MSLLIKALDKAQAEKAQTKKSAAKERSVKPKKRTKSGGVRQPSSITADLSLTPAEPNTKSESRSSEVPTALRGSSAGASQNIAEQAKTATMAKPVAPVSESQATGSPVRAQAANVFAAKRTEPSNQIAKLAILTGLVLLALMALLAYWYQTNINTPDIVIPPRPALAQELSQEMPEPLASAPQVSETLPEVKAVNEEPAFTEPDVVTAVAAEIEMQTEVVESALTPESHIAPIKTAKPATITEENPRPESILRVDEDVQAVANTLTRNERVVDSSEVVEPVSVVLADVGIASKSASIKITQQKKASGVNPILMRAYEAYNAGNNSQASKDYKEVLMRYGSNVDAMLGLGAIATKQGRLADANGWYRKVLEVEPRNEAAKSSLLSIQQESQPQAGESRIKSMLAVAPNDANLHAALGDVYASKNLWPAAQQAYFDAYRFNPSAENALNLGVSLDQMTKPKLALPYYQEALEKANQSNAIDTEVLKARILSIE